MRIFYPQIPGIVIYWITISGNILADFKFSGHYLNNFLLPVFSLYILQKKVIIISNDNFRK